MKFLAGHFAILYAVRMLLVRESEANMLGGLPIKVLSEESLRILLLFLSRIHLALFAGRVRGLRNVVVKLLEIKTHHNKLPGGVCCILFKLPLY